LTAPQHSADLAPACLEVLHGFKRLLARHPEVNVTPFSDHQVVCYRTAVTDLDVPEIHAATRLLVEQTIADVQRSQTARVILLAGNPGMGKSHLVNHFRRPEVACQHRYLLVSMTNHWDVGDFEERLLDSLLSALVHPSPDAPHALLERVEAIAFTALDQLLRQPGGVRSFRPVDRGVLGRLLGRLRRSDHDRLAKMLAKRDLAAFRLLDFHKFSSYVCDRFLAEPGNPLHRHVLRVLLCYLFPAERELVLHWLRGRPTQGHFTRKLGVEEELDRTYKRMDAVRLLISLFARDVSEGLAGRPDSPLVPQVFLFAFDQAEGRNELFDAERDWHVFFAHLAELYNSLPNVLVLFTMTLHLRDRLHPRMEKQFQDRIRRDERFALRYVEDREVLSLYRRRLERWIGPGEETLRESLRQAGEDYLPFTRAEVLERSGEKTLRDVLAELDREFRQRILDTPTKVPFDYLSWRREFQQGLSGDPYEDTKAHIGTVAMLLANLGEEFAGEYGVQLSPPQSVDGEGVDALLLRFTDPANSANWIRIYLSRLSVHFRSKVEKSLGLLSNLKKTSNFLWLVRPNPIDEDEYAVRGEQTCFSVLPVETEVAFKALNGVAGHSSEYPDDEWKDGLPFLIGEMRKTYLGELFDHARQAIEALRGVPAEARPEPLADPSAS
jgi:hypothetical protein